ncbi:MAG: ATP12 family chaperone protein [Flavobacteriaceae bacterium]
MSEGRKIDPMLAARLAKPVLPKRFYENADVGPHEDAEFVLLLDGRPARTPARRLIRFANAALGRLAAAEWNAQKEFIDPSGMPVTRLANTAIDGMDAAAPAVRDDLARYAGSDLVCYRAGEPEGLVEAQNRHWDALVRLADGWGMRLNLAEGIVHVEQPERSLSRARALVESLEGIVLAAAHVLVTLTGSYVIAMALIRGEIGPDEAWAAAHVDEDWQISLWGEDAEAAERRALRRREFDAAVAILRAAGSD